MSFIRTKNKGPIASVILLVVLVAGAGAYVYLKNYNSGNQYKPGEARTSSNEPTAQPDFTDGSEREPGSSVGEHEGSGAIVDSRGANSSDTSQAIVSSGGEITVYLPHKDSTVRSGQEVSGISSLSSVSYRIIDDVTGQIGTGKLQVIDGKFSGMLEFDTGASEGRLDIFGTKADFSEFANISIPLEFQ